MPNHDQSVHYATRAPRWPVGLALCYTVTNYFGLSRPLGYPYIQQHLRSMSVSQRDLMSLSHSYSSGTVVFQRSALGLKGKSALGRAIATGMHIPDSCSNLVPAHASCMHAVVNKAKIGSNLGRPAPPPCTQRKQTFPADGPLYQPLVLSRRLYIDHINISTQVRITAL